MKRVIASAITLLCVACGGSDEPTEVPVARDAKAGARTDNQPPEIAKAVIEPAGAGASTPLTLEVVANDPDRDRVDVTIEWYRNAELVEDLTERSVPAETFARGDRVYAMVYASDGSEEVTRQSATIIIANSPPTVRRISVNPTRPTALDLIQVEADVQDVDGDSFETRYRWLRNGQPIADADSPRLPPGIGHRAEQIVVQVQATDGSAESEWVASAALVLANAPPAITTQPNYALSGSGGYSYEVAAKDPDGDRPLKYELVEGPQGMSVDVVSGVVTWRVPADAKGVYPIELAVSDPYGGKTTQKYSLAVDWNDAPASAGKAAGGAPAAAAGAKPNAVPAAQAGDGSAAEGDEAAPEEGDEDYTDEDQGEESADDEF